MKRLAVGTAAWAIIATTGCSTPPPLPEPILFMAPVESQVTGDWNDVETAVRVGASQSEIAIEQTLRPSDDRIVFELRTITDEPARLEVAMLPDPSATSDEGRRMTLLARVGRFGNEAWEERLIGRVKVRLEDLRGVDVAPVRLP